MMYFLSIDTWNTSWTPDKEGGILSLSPTAAGANFFPTNPTPVSLQRSAPFARGPPVHAREASCPLFKFPRAPLSPLFL